MKLPACRQGRHGACDGTDVLETITDGPSDRSLVTHRETFACECYCHSVGIPDPDPGEVLYDPSA